MYTRDTELRRLQSNDVNRLAEALGFDGGRKLMETIPKHWSAQDIGNVGDAGARGSHKLNGETRAMNVVELKYRPEQIRLIEEATRQTSGCYFAEILIQEWSTSGRKYERPTVGLLLQLLIKADLWNAADFVAEHFLSEAAPERPLEGPGAKVDISIPTECLRSVMDYANDSIDYPDTEALNDNANGVDTIAEHNRDYYMKFHMFSKDMNSAAPKPPPRAQRAARQQHLKQQQLFLKNQQKQLQPIQTNNDVASADTTDLNRSKQIPENLLISNHTPTLNSSFSSTMTTQNIPEISDLLHMNGVDMPTLLSSNSDTVSDAIISTPDVATISNAAATSSTSASALGASLPLITELNLNTVSADVSSSAKVSSCNTTNQLPPQEVATLSPNALSDDSRCSSLNNDSFDDDDDEIGYNSSVNMSDVGNVDAELADGNSGDQSLPCLSAFGRQSPNNDSSLTTVTCTSGDNSFDLSLNDSSSTSTTDPTAQRK